MRPSGDRDALSRCRFTGTRHIWIENSDVDLNLGGRRGFAAAVAFRRSPLQELIEPPGHQRGPAKWHGDQVLLSKYNGNVCGAFRLGIDVEGFLFFERNVAPQPLRSNEVVEDESWHVVVCSYDGEELSIFLDGVLCASEQSGSQLDEEETPLLIGSNLLR